MIELTNISKTFKTAEGELTALNDVTVHIRPKEIFGFIGFSGAGKSTLLRCINLLERPESGKVLIEGHDLLALSKKQLRISRQHIGMIFQQYNLLNNATVFENVCFTLEIMGVPKAKRRDIVMKSLEIVDLVNKADDYPAKLSGGQKQRVAISRAIASQPKILLCDEPTSALDPQTTKNILDYLKKVNDELGITIVFVTHEMEAARKLCDRVAVMENGRVLEVVDMAEEKHHASTSLGEFLFTDGGGI
ncbi:MAG: ATP-binding cassette domain-containing protein [Ruminococcus sp.]|nr:ATP-binding cassette domain-containing protein [Ruminococcus sp.]